MPAAFASASNCTRISTLVAGFGEGGIRTPEVIADPVTCRLYVAPNATPARDATAPCLILPDRAGRLERSRAGLTVRLPARAVGPANTNEESPCGETIFQGLFGGRKVYGVNFILGLSLIGALTYPPKRVPRSGLRFSAVS